ncbi:MAG: LPS assembly lipoprotein LptE [Deltaproteobacteria bacterium]|nr:LPS assembly lipoprotein LptE [Deltaproteobacteria bacterium]
MRRVLQKNLHFLIGHYHFSMKFSGSFPNAKWIRYFIFCGALFFTGCGYHFQGGGTSLPPDIRSVAVPIFANSTTQTGIESEVTRALVDKFISAKRLSVSGQNSADALLKGTVKSFTATSVAVTGGTQITTGYRATLTVEIIFQRQKDGKTLFKEELSEWWNYPVVSDLAMTENNKKDAIRKISLLLAEKIHELILENF